MKKMPREQKISVTIGICVIVCIILYAFHYVFYYDVFKKPVVLSEVPQEFQVVNENNFADYNVLDLNETYVAYYTFHGINSKITVFKDNKPIRVVHNAFKQFRLVEDKLIYVEELFGMRLYLLDLSTGKKSKISGDVYYNQFYIYQGDVIYTTNDHKLMRFDLETMESHTFTEFESFPQDFSLVGDTIIYPITNNGREDIGKFSLIDGSHETLSLKNNPASGSFWDCRIYGDELVQTRRLWNTDSLCFFNPETDVLREVTLYEGENMLCEQWTLDDEYVYISFDVHKEIDHITVIPIKHELNGLWRFNIQTLEREKVSDVVYDWLGYYGENLVGTIDNELYIIDTETFEATKLIAMK